MSYKKAFENLDRPLTSGLWPKLPNVLDLQIFSGFEFECILYHRAN